jgi:hypothetical protein
MYRFTLETGWGTVGHGDCGAATHALHNIFVLHQQPTMCYTNRMTHKH